MPEISILDSLLGTFLDAAFGKAAAALDKRRTFLHDLGVFLRDQEKHTQLDVFLFSRRPKYGAEESADDFLKLEEIYIPLRMDQLRGTLPDFQEFRENPEKHEGLRDQKIKNLNIAGLLDLMRTEKNFRKIMILGTAGSGKSTFMKYLTRLLVVKKQDRQVKVLEKNKKGEAIESTRPIELNAVPIFIRLRDLEKQLRKYNDPKWENSYSLTDFVAVQCGQPLRSEQFFSRLFQGMPCLFLLDGIDEVPENKLVDGILIARRRVMDWLLRQIKHLEQENPDARFILTSRPTDTGNLVRHFQIFAANNFNLAEIHLFTEYWYQGCEKAFRFNIESEYMVHKMEKWTKRLQRLPERKMQFLEEVSRPPLKEIIENPLLLSLALYIHAMEERFSVENKEKLYERFSEAFLYEWDEVRDMNFYPELFGSGNYERLYEVTYRIAFHFSKNESTKMSARDILPALKDAIGRYHLIPPETLEELSRELLQAFYERNGLLYCREASYDFLDTEFEFQHKSFQDYLTAQCIRADLLVESGDFSFHDKFGKDFWDRTLEFYVNLPTPDLFFKKTIEEIEPGSQIAKNLHFFTYHFLNARQKRPELVEQLALKIADTLLQSKSIDEIYIASQCLNRLPGTPPEPFIELVATRYNNDQDAFRAGRAVWVLAQKKHYSAIRDSLIEKITKLSKDIYLDNFYIRQWLIVPTLMGDFEVFTKILEIYKKATPFGKKILTLYFCDLVSLWVGKKVMKLRGLPGELIILDRLDMKGLCQVLDKMGMMDSINTPLLAISKDLRQIFMPKAVAYYPKPNFNPDELPRITILEFWNIPTHQDTIQNIIVTPQIEKWISDSIAKLLTIRKEESEIYNEGFYNIALE